MPVWLETAPNLPRISRDMCLLGLDYGQKRVGSALAGAGWELVTPLKVIHYNKWAKLATDLRKLATDYQPDIIVIGYPLHADGTPGIRAQATRDFAKLLLADKVFGTDAKIILADERRSSLAADMLGATRDNRDALAAMTILEDFIARR